MLSGSHRCYDGNEINMDELDNLDNYNGDPVHNMEVDYGHHINTGEPPTNYGYADLYE